MTRELKRLMAACVGRFDRGYLLGIIHNIGRGDHGNMTLRKLKSENGERKIQVLGEKERVFYENSQANRNSVGPPCECFRLYFL
jgi:hypothetical protein